MSLDSLWPASWPLPAIWRGALPALVAALAWVGLLRLLKRRDLAALGMALGLAVGWALALGLPIASPRQFAERLPLLAFAGFAAALLLATVAAGRAWASALGAALLLAAGAWWLAGAPSAAADVRRALVAILALGGLAALACLELRSPSRAVVAFALTLAAVWITRPAGPWPVLAAAGAAAALGGLPAGAPWTVAAAAPVALVLAGLAAGPVLARGAAFDWTAGAAPFAALSLGPALAARIGGRAGPAIGWTVAGGLPLLITWLLARNP